MTKDELAQAVAEVVGISKGDARECIDALAATVADELRQGREIHVDGLGTWHVTAETRKAPGEAEAARGGEVHFRASVELRDAAGDAPLPEDAPAPDAPAPDAPADPAPEPAPAPEEPPADAPPAEDPPAQDPPAEDPPATGRGRGRGKR